MPTNEPEFFEDHTKAFYVEQNKIKKKILVPKTQQDRFATGGKEFLETKPNETIRLDD